MMNDNEFVTNDQLIQMCVSKNAVIALVGKEELMRRVRMFMPEPVASTLPTKAVQTEDHECMIQGCTAIAVPGEDYCITCSGPVEYNARNTVQTEEGDQQLQGFTDEFFKKAWKL